MKGKLRAGQWQEAIWGLKDSVAAPPPTLAGEALLHLCLRSAPAMKISGKRWIPRNKTMPWMFCLVLQNMKCLIGRGVGGCVLRFMRWYVNLLLLSLVRMSKTSLPWTTPENFLFYPVSLRISGKLSGLNSNVENSRFNCQSEYLFKYQLLLNVTV